MIDADNEGDEHIYIKVGGGCHLGINPDDFIEEETKKSSLSNSFNYQIDSWGYSLPILGGMHSYFFKRIFELRFNWNFNKRSENFPLFYYLLTFYASVILDKFSKFRNSSLT